MQVLIPDDRRSQRDYLRHLIQREREVQVSGIAKEVENAPEKAILSGRLALPLHTFVRFEPIRGKEQQLREELKSLLEPTRAEPGCIRIHLYEALRDPLIFYIHSEWVDEAAFEAHPKLPHMTRFLDLVRELVTHPVKGIRTRQIE